MFSKNLFLMICIIIVVVGCQSNDESTDSYKAEKELRQVIEQIWVDVVSGDLEALRSTHLDSPKFSKFGPRIAERQDVKSTNESETEHVLLISDASFELEDIKVDVFGDVAVTTFYNNFSFIKNNIRVKGKGRVTLVFLNTEEGWKIIHEHSSPFN
jgi:ketosteroid isomerase-like protein